MQLPRLSTTATNTSLTVSVTPLTGSLATQVQYRELGGPKWLVAANLLGTSVQSVTIADQTTGDLHNGTSFEVRQVPFNNAGPGVPSKTLVAATTGTAPVVITSDSFSGNGVLAGTNSDAGGGGTAKPYTTTGTATRNGLGGLRQTAGNAVLDSGSTDGRVRARVTVPPDSAVAYVTMRYTDAANHYRCTLDKNGNLQIVGLTTAGGSVVIASYSTGAVPGQSVELSGRAVGNNLRLSIDRQVMLSVTDSTITTGTKWGTAAGAQTDWDDLVVLDK